MVILLLENYYHTFFACFAAASEQTANRCRQQKRWNKTFCNSFGFNATKCPRFVKKRNVCASLVSTLKTSIPLFFTDDLAVLLQTVSYLSPTIWSLRRLVIQQASLCRPLPDFYLPVRTNVIASEDRQQQPPEPAAYVLPLSVAPSFTLAVSSLFPPPSVCAGKQT